MKGSSLKVVLLGFAIALPLAEFGVRQSRWLSMGVNLIVLMSVLLWIWYAGRRPDLGSWVLRAFINIALGAVIFDNFLRGAGECPHPFFTYISGCGFVLIYALLFLMLFGPERFRREPKSKPPFSLLGN